MRLFWAWLLGTSILVAGSPPLIPENKGKYLREKPAMNLPVHMRQANWTRTGSCVHASWTSLLRWQHQYKWADYWCSHYSGGENWDGMVAKLRATGLPCAGTYGKRDVAFLEMCCKTRRGCMVTVMGGKHMVNLVDLDKRYAYILDNNDVKIIHKVDRDEFLNEWYKSYSWAMTPLYSPLPPLEIKA